MTVQITEVINYLQKFQQKNGFEVMWSDLDGLEKLLLDKIQENKREVVKV